LSRGQTLADRDETWAEFSTLEDVVRMKRTHSSLLTNCRA
jgi:hypothetical protein